MSSFLPCIACDTLLFPGRQHSIDARGDRWLQSYLESTRSAHATLCLAWTRDPSLGMIVALADRQVSSLTSGPDSDDGAGEPHTDLIVVVAQQRCRIDHATTDRGDIVWAKITPIDDDPPNSCLSNMRGNEFRHIETWMRSASVALKQFYGRFGSQPQWRNLFDALSRLDRKKPADMSYMLSSILTFPQRPGQETGLDTVRELFIGTSTPRRLKLTVTLLQQFMANQPKGASHSAKLESSTDGIRAAARHGGVAPRHMTDSPVRLATICLHYVCDNIFHYGPMLEKLGPLVSMVVDELNTRAMMHASLLKQLQAVRQFVHSIHLFGKDIGQDEVDLLHSFPLKDLRLQTCTWLTDDLVRPLLSAQPDLEILSLDRCRRLTDEALLAVLPSLKHLKRLSLSGTRVTRATVEIASQLPSLQYVDFSCMSKFDDECAEMLFQHGQGPGFTTVLLADSHISTNGTQALATHASLRELSLSLNGKIQEWTFLSKLSHLVDLDLSLNFRVNDETVAMLASCTPQLKNLILTKTEITDACGPSLAKLTNLRMLDVSRTGLGDGVGPSLSSLAKLSVLLMAFTPASSQLAAHLATSSRLRVLKLTGCPSFGDRAVELLCNGWELQQSLEGLFVGSSGITNSSVQSLAQLKNLVSLQLWETRITSTAADRLSELTGLFIDKRIRCTQGTWILLSQDRVEW